MSVMACTVYSCAMISLFGVASLLDFLVSATVYVSVIQPSQVIRQLTYLFGILVWDMSPDIIHSF